MKRREEIANWLTHGIGLCMSIAGVLFMIQTIDADDDIRKIFSIVIYGIALILLYTFSTLYHAVQGSSLKKKFQIADHSAIYIKIAGTYTPFSLLTLKDHYGLLLLAAIWGLAGLGIAFKLIHSAKYNIASTIIYLAMGWLAVVVVDPLFEKLSMEGFIFLLAGGLSYTLGVIFFLWEKLPYSHPIWHLFVLGGSIFHYMAILLFVL